MTRQRIAMVSALVALLASAGCARAPEPATGCTPSETLVELDGQTMVMVNDCGEPFTRPATSADLARLEAPL